MINNTLKAAHVPPNSVGQPGASASVGTFFKAATVQKKNPQSGAALTTQGQTSASTATPLANRNIAAYKDLTLKMSGLEDHQSHKKETIGHSDWAENTVIKRDGKSWEFVNHKRHKKTIRHSDWAENTVIRRDGKSWEFVNHKRHKEITRHSDWAENTVIRREGKSWEFVNHKWRIEG